MRKAFKFTDDNDSDDMPEALDEEGKSPYTFDLSD